METLSNSMDLKPNLWELKKKIKSPLSSKTPMAQEEHNYQVVDYTVGWSMRVN